MLRAFALFGALLGMMGWLGSVAAAPAAPDEDAVRPLGIGLEEIAYPYPVQFLDLVIEGQAVRIAWDFLGPHIDEQVLDFYHASQYLARAAAAIFKHEQEREQWLDEQCHNLKHKHHAAQRILRELEQAPTTKMKPDQKKDLQDCITYFGNHLHQMRYARYIENRIPIGSRVTEAA